MSKEKVSSPYLHSGCVGLWLHVATEYLCLMKVRKHLIYFTLINLNLKEFTVLISIMPPPHEAPKAKEILKALCHWFLESQQQPPASNLPGNIKPWPLFRRSLTEDCQLLVDKGVSSAPGILSSPLTSANQICPKDTFIELLCIPKAELERRNKYIHAHTL